MEPVIAVSLFLLHGNYCVTALKKCGGGMRFPFGTTPSRRS